MTLYLFLIALMIVYVTDITGFPQEMLKVVWKYAYKTRPFPEDLQWSDIHPLLKICECSRCQTWWVTFLVSLCCGWLTIPIAAYCMFLSLMTPVFNDLLHLVVDFLSRMIETIADYFGL